MKTSHPYYSTLSAEQILEQIAQTEFFLRMGEQRYRFFCLTKDARQKKLRKSIKRLRAQIVDLERSLEENS